VTGFGLITQHPIASAAVSHAYQEDARGPLDTYNFAGDVGKAVIPSGASVLLSLMSWHQMLRVVSALGAIVALAVATYLPAICGRFPQAPKSNIAGLSRVEGSRCS
jgi:hypothetical protein